MQSFDFLIFQGGVIIVYENNFDYKYVYLVCVIIGWWKNVGIIFSVSLFFVGIEGYSGCYCLSEFVLGRQCFLLGYEDWFLVIISYSFGDFWSFLVWYDSFGKFLYWLVSCEV